MKKQLLFLAILSVSFLSWSISEVHKNKLFDKIFNVVSFTDLSDKEKYTRLFEWAARNGYVGILQILINDALVNLNEIIEDDSLNPLYMAIIYNQGSIITFLVRNGFNIDRYAYGQTGLMYAAKKGDWDMVEFLLDNGASLHLCDEKGFTPAEKAALEGYVYLADHLFELMHKEQTPIRINDNDQISNQDISCEEVGASINKEQRLVNNKLEQNCIFVRNLIKELEALAEPRK